MIVRIAPRQGRARLVAVKSARWEARAWGHYLDYLALCDTPPAERTAAESARLAAALDDCEYCCRRLERLSARLAGVARASYDPPQTPGVHALPAGYVYNPPELPSPADSDDPVPRGPRREFGASSRARRGASSAVVLTGLTAAAGVGLWRLVGQLFRVD